MGKNYRLDHSQVRLRFTGSVGRTSLPLDVLFTAQNTNASNVYADKRQADRQRLQQGEADRMMRLKHRDDTGSMLMALLVVTVVMSLSAVLVPIVVRQIRTTVGLTDRNTALNAAQAGNGRDDGAGPGRPGSGHPWTATWRTCRRAP